MTIVKNAKIEKPDEGVTVFCDNGKFCSDRAEYKNGKFMSVADFPVKSYEMKHVTKWFYWDEYVNHFKNKGLFDVSFDIAESINGVNK